MENSNQTELFSKLGTPEQLLLNNVRDMNEFRNKSFESQFVIALKNVLLNGTLSGDRTGTGTKRIQSQQIHIDLNHEFPILRGKKMGFKTALIEMMWIMTGRNDLKFLKDNGVNYWDEWVKDDGTFGPSYGPQMRNFGERKYYDNINKPELITLPGFDQLKETVKLLRNNPDSRRIIVNLWNPMDLEKVALPWCHYGYHICSYIDNDGIRKIDLHAEQRSADSFLGVPYDFMLFAFYTYILSLLSGYKVGKIHCNFHDFHMYLNHEEQVNKYIDNYINDPKELFQYNKQIIPELIINEKYINLPFEKMDIDELLNLIIDNDFDFFQLINYKNNSYDKIEAPIAV
jgi:thymidylate synthase